MEENFIKKMLNWKPEFGNKNHKKVLKLREKLENEIDKTEIDEDVVDSLIKEIKFYL